MVVGVQQGGMSCSVLEFAGGETGFGSRVREVVEGMSVYLGDASA